MTIVRITLLDGTTIPMPPHAGKYEYLATHAALQERVKDEIYDGVAKRRGPSREVAQVQTMPIRFFPNQGLSQ